MLLRIYTDQDALVGDRALADVILRHARDLGVAGATVLRGRNGFGASAHAHGHRPFDLIDNLPLVLEFVDDEATLRTFAASLEDVEDIGLVTLEKVEVLRYGRRPARG
jgi:PII-like signaling protein